MKTTTAKREAFVGSWGPHTLGHHVFERELDALLDAARAEAMEWAARLCASRAARAEEEARELRRGGFVGVTMAAEDAAREARACEQEIRRSMATGEECQECSGTGHLPSGKWISANSAAVSHCEVCGGAGRIRSAAERGSKSK